MIGKLEKIMEHSFVGNLIGSDSVVLDIGANKGEFAMQIVEKFGAIVYAIEPVPELFLKIPHSERIKKFNYCIAEKAGTVSLSVPKDRCATLYPKTAEEKNRTIFVEAVTLGTFLEKHNIQEVDLLKLDIEGAEIGLFQSATPDTLKKIRQITVEFHYFLYPETKGVVEEIKKKIESLGFRCITFSFTTNGDVLFVRNNSLSFFANFYLKYPYKYVMGFSRLARKLWKKII